jgi:hypothetical protein
VAVVVAVAVAVAVLSKVLHFSGVATKQFVGAGGDGGTGVGTDDGDAPPPLPTKDGSGIMRLPTPIVAPYHLSAFFSMFSPIN